MEIEDADLTINLCNFNIIHIINCIQLLSIKFEKQLYYMETLCQLLYLMPYIFSIHEFINILLINNWNLLQIVQLIIDIIDILAHANIGDNIIITYYIYNFSNQHGLFTITFSYFICLVDEFANNNIKIISIGIELIKRIGIG